MTAAAIIEAAAADGVRLALTEVGTLKATGHPDSVRCWVPHLKAHKTKIIKLLSTSAATRASGWLLHFLDREPLEVWTAPPATLDEVLADYPEAVAAEPLAEVRTPVSAEFRICEGAQRCRSCRHLTRPGRADGYCAERIDLPHAYGADHPLRQLPADGGEDCRQWAPYD